MDRTWNPQELRRRNEDDEGETLADLVRRYLRKRGGKSPEDVTRWLGEHGIQISTTFAQALLAAIHKG